jgi:glycosyltransferase involved in cell wall biosynthesis
MATAFLVEKPPMGTVCLPDGRRGSAVLQASREKPPVSCVMVSRGRVEILRHSVGCFLRQTYENRELVVVLQAMPPDLQAYLDSVRQATHRLRVHVVPPGLRLGDLRNMAIARAEGRVICQWDDDDLHHATYLDDMVGFLEANQVASVFLYQWTVWWPARRLFALSNKRIWEGSMVARRTAIPIYPDIEKREDTAVANILTRRRAFVAVQAPQLYIYTITGQNTWDEGHLVRMTEGEGAARCAEEAYDPIFARLDSLYDVAAYRRHCLAAARG